MSMTTLVGFFAGFLTTISFLPQVVKTWKSKSASDLSLGMFSVFSLGVMFWLAYGFLIQEPPIIFWNTVTLVLALTILIMKLKFDS
ncbi:MAG: SemiSWEET transporter [Nitrospina sp.]|nr:SemiSWEET transporter [Nitrospina sp.]